MNPQEEFARACNRIGAIAKAKYSPFDQFFFYAMVPDWGVVATAAFLREQPGSNLKWVEMPEIAGITYALWETLRKEGAEWYVLCYNLIQNEVSVDVQYRDQFDPEEIDELSLRNALLKKYFALPIAVDYPHFEEGGPAQTVHIT